MKKGRFRLIGVLYTIIFFLFGAAAVLLTETYGWKMDLTENRLYTLSDESEEILSEISEPVTVTVFNQETECPLILKNLLARYSRTGQNVSVFYSDPYREPERVRAYEEMGYVIELDDLMIESGDRYQQIKLADLYEMNESGTQIEKIMAERVITSAIHQVTSGEKTRILFTDGHGEEPSGTLMELFSSNHYQTGYTELSVLGIDMETEILVICAPKRDFSAEDIAVLEDYLTSGGSAMIFLEPGAGNLENLMVFLQDWGIIPANQAVKEPDLFVSGSELNIAATYAPHEINQFFTNNRYYVIIPSCVALKQAYVKQGTTKTQQVLHTSAAAYTEENTALGAVGLVLTSERTVTLEDGSSAEGRLFVSGSKQIYGDDLLTSAKLANHDFLVQAAAWCAEDSGMISIPATEMEDTYLPVVAQEARILILLMLGVLPVGILAIGTFISLHRRYL